MFETKLVQIGPETIVVETIFACYAPIDFTGSRHDMTFSLSLILPDLHNQLDFMNRLSFEKLDGVGPVDNIPSID